MCWVYLLPLRTSQAPTATLIAHQPPNPPKYLLITELASSFSNGKVLQGKSTLSEVSTQYPKPSQGSYCPRHHTKDFGIRHNGPANELVAAAGPVS